MKMVSGIYKAWREMVALTWASDLEVGDVVFAGYRVRETKKGTAYIAAVPNLAQARDKRYRRRNAVAYATVDSVSDEGDRIVLALGGIPGMVSLDRYDDVCVVARNDRYGWRRWWEKDPRELAR